MSNWAKVLAVLDEQHTLLEHQQCLIETQQVQIQKQLRRIELQARLMGITQAELDVLKQSLNPAPQQTPRKGNGQHGTARRGERETVSTSL